MKKGLVSLGISDKDLTTGVHYGFGAKTAIPRIAAYGLIFSRDRVTHCRTVVLLSSAFAKTMKSPEAYCPVCSWRPQGDTTAIVPYTNLLAPYSHASRLESLDCILRCKGCPYINAECLLAEFDTLGSPSSGGTGTRIVMWEIRKDVILSDMEDDILVVAPADAPPHEVSLRAYAEVTRLCKEVDY